MTKTVVSNSAERCDEGFPADREIGFVRHPKCLVGCLAHKSLLPGGVWSIKFSIALARTSGEPAGGRCSPGSHDSSGSAGTDAIDTNREIRCNELSFKLEKHSIQIIEKGDSH